VQKKIQRSNLLQLCKQGYNEKGMKSLTSLRIIEEIKLGVSFAGNVCQIYGYAFVSKKLLSLYRDVAYKLTIHRPDSVCFATFNFKRTDMRNRQQAFSRCSVLLSVIFLAGLLVSCQSDGAKFESRLDSGMNALEKQEYKKAEIELRNALQLEKGNAQAYYYLGEAFLHQGKIGEAFQAYREAVTLKPQFPDAQLRMAALYLGANRVQDAEDTARDVLDQETNNVQARYLVASSMIRQGDFSQAITELQTVLELDPEHEEAHFLLARCYLEKKEPVKAKKIFEAAASLENDSARAEYILARFYMSQSNWTAAEKTLQNIVSTFPEEPMHSLALAEFYANRQQMDKAEQVLKDTLSQHPKNSQTYRALAQLYLAQGKTQAAENILKKGRDTATDSLLPSLELGRLYASQGKTDQAITTWQNAAQKFPEDVRPHQEIASLYYTMNQYSQALEHIQSIMDIDSGHIQARLLKAKIKLKENDLQETKKIAQQVVRDQPDLAEASFILALAHFGLGEDNQGQTHLDEALKADPNHVRANLMKAEILLRERKIDQVLELTSKVTDSEPQEMRAHLLQGRAYLAQENVQAAKESFEKVVDLAPKRPEGHLYLGMIHRHQEDFSAALESFHQALSVAPGSTTAMKEIVTTHLKQNQPDEALTFCRDQLKTHDESPQLSSYILFLQGQAHLQAKDIPAAKDTLQQAIDRNPDWASPYMLLARLEAATGQLDQAIDRYQALHAKQPEYLPAVMTLGILMELKGDWEKAQEFYEKCLEINDEFVPAANNLAYLLIENGGNIDRALSLAQTAKRLSPDDPGVSDTLGWVLVQKNAYTSAIAHFEDALDQLSSNPTIHYHMAVAHHRNGNLPTAQEHLELALQKNAPFPEKDKARSLLQEIENTQVKKTNG
jgi:tetratricopeptide (TPR) repeat protein